MSMADKHIKLIVTGDSEKKSLHKSLQNCFPTHTANGDLVVWDVPRKAIHGGSTSHRLSADSPPLASMTKLVDEMFAETIASKKPKGSPPDFVIVIDDVELGNVGQEAVVVQAFLAAVNAKLALLQAEHSASHFKWIQTRVQECCSFHLLCPMVEAYFFADPATLISEGVTTNNHPLLAHPTDVEQFDASPDPHPDWLAICRAKDKEQKIIHPWWETSRHPKHYLTHLLTISAAPAYHETTLGARMIEATNWAAVAKTSTDSPIISALLEDIWDWFEQLPPAGSFQGSSSTTTYRVTTTHPSQRLLRNI